MSIYSSFIMAAFFTLLYIFYIGVKIIDVDFSCFLPNNSKKAMRKKLLAQRNTPLQGANLRRDIRKAFENILVPLGKANKNLLPSRMDLNFRREIEGQIQQLAEQGLCRDIRLINVVPLPKNDFTHWKDDGREWRESELQCTALERFIPLTGGNPVHEIYRKNAYLRVLQSRHIRNSDRTDEKRSYYANRVNINCPSCGAQLKLHSQQTVCPYCGSVIQSEFYDWQTEVFEIYEELSANLLWFLLLFISGAVLFISVFLCLWLIPDTQISLAAGVGVAFLVVVMFLFIAYFRKRKQERLAEKIALYSENYLRSCINETLYKKDSRADLMDYGVGSIILKRVVNMEKNTTITVRVQLSETYLPPGKRPYTRKYKRTLTLQRARYPKKRKSDGNFFIERECPSCGANFIPDSNHCCSFCGYSLQKNNYKWTLPTS